MSRPISHRIHPDPGVVVTVWTGPATDAQMQDSHRALYASPSWRPGMHELVDLRAADLSGITLQGMRELAAIVGRAVAGSTEPPFRTALLVSSALEFGMARLYEGHQADAVGDVQVFRTEHEALGWLGLSGWPTGEGGVPVEVP